MPKVHFFEDEVKISPSSGPPCWEIVITSSSGRSRWRLRDCRGSS